MSESAEPVPSASTAPAGRGNLRSRVAAGTAPLATLIATVTLRFSHYPGRQLVGTFHRKQARTGGARGFEVTTGDGVRLHCWHFPAAGDQPRRLPVVMLHGWLEVKEFHFPRAEALSRRGHEVILFDHRGHGRSGGGPASFGIREARDLTAVIDAGQARGILGDRVITMGFSMGAATVLRQAVGDRRVAGVVALAPFVTLRKAISSFRERLAPRVSDRWLLAGFERAARAAGYELDEASTLEAIQQLDRPVLLVEAGEDRNLPPADHIAPLTARASKHIERFTVPEASHVSLCRQQWHGLELRLERFCTDLSEQT